MGLSINQKVYSEKNNSWYRIASKRINKCEDCAFYHYDSKYYGNHAGEYVCRKPSDLSKESCSAESREDGMDIIYKLIK